MAAPTSSVLEQHRRERERCVSSGSLLAGKEESVHESGPSRASVGHCESGKKISLPVAL